MRRYLLPAVVLVVAIVASVLMSRADNAADPGDPVGVAATPSLGTPLLNVRRAPEWLRQPTNDGLLESAVRATISRVAENNPACVSVRRDGEPIAQVNNAASLIPGDLQRLATLTAFGALGAQNYTTDVVRDSADVVTDGVLEGNLWLVGGADPVLSTAAFIERFGDDRARTSFDELAGSVITALQDAGITTINGSVIGDETKYEGGERAYPEPYWTPADVASNVAGPISALLVDNGFETFPEEVEAAANRRADNPALHAATLLTDSIRAAGIVVEGTPTVGVQPDAVSRNPIASISSPPIADIAQRAMFDATTAEMLFREIAVRSGKDASQGSAFFAVPGLLVSAGVVQEDEVGLTGALDGSGTSDLDRQTCGVIANILTAGDDTLAVGALPSIDRTTLAACAPTGLEELETLATAREEVTAMAGRAVASNGDTLTFAVIVNWLPDTETGELAPRTVCDGVVPALLDKIVEHPSGPALDQLSPLDPVAIS
jgi:serine-type D-Ala-D-Ala carboxypeptidase/endopeptidase (penicillin-binding protein 4)